MSAGAIGSPHLLLLSGIGPRHELDAHGVPCLVDAPHVGKHLQDHLMCPLFYPAPGIGVTMNDLALSMGPDALRAPAGPLPADPADDENLSPELQAMKVEAERRFNEWEATGRGLGASSLGSTRCIKMKAEYAMQIVDAQIHVWRTVMPNLQCHGTRPYAAADTYQRSRRWMP